MFTWSVASSQPVGEILNMFDININKSHQTFWIQQSATVIEISNNLGLDTRVGNGRRNIEHV